MFIESIVDLLNSKWRPPVDSRELINYVRICIGVIRRKGILILMTGAMESIVWLHTIILFAF